MQLAINSGIFFTCQKCSKCCKYKFGWGIQLFPDDVSMICEYLNLSSTDFIKKYCLLSQNDFIFKDTSLSIEYIELDLISTKSCPFLLDNLCNIHIVKPYSCRQGPFIEPLLANSNFWKMNIEKCPGFGKGYYYSLNVIKDMAREDEKKRHLYDEKYRSLQSVWNIYSIDKMDIFTVRRRYQYEIEYEVLSRGYADAVCIYFENS